MDNLTIEEYKFENRTYCINALYKDIHIFSYYSDKPIDIDTILPAIYNRVVKYILENNIKDYKYIRKF